MPDGLTIAEAAVFDHPAARRSWLPSIGVGVLLFAAYATTLYGMAGSWFDQLSNMEHGVLVPVVAVYMVWLKRDTLKKIPAEPCIWGNVLVALALVQCVLGTAAHWTWFSRIAFLIALVGCLLTLYGLRIVRALMYPLCTLLLMIAPPSFLYDRLTLDLQLLASRLGEVFLESLGYSVLREGNILEMVGERMAVAEACSGIKSLMALIFLTTSYCYFFVPQKRTRVILFLGVVPIAILCNAGRILATGIVGQYNHELAHGMLHAAFGYFSLATGAVLCILLHSLVTKLGNGGSQHA